MAPITIDAALPETLEGAKLFLDALFHSNAWELHKERIESYRIAVTLLLHFPELASHRFGLHGGFGALSPLTLLLMSHRHATLEVVQSIYALYPPAVNICNDHPGIFPLYMAFAHGGADTKMVLFLADKLDQDNLDNCPQILSLFSFSDSVNQSRIMPVMQLLLDKYPGLASYQNKKGKTILDFAFDYGYPTTFLTCILEKSQPGSLGMSIQCPCGMPDDRRKVLGQIIPKLTRLTWDTHTSGGLDILEHYLNESSSTTLPLQLTNLELTYQPSGIQDRLAGARILETLLKHDQLVSLRMDTNTDLNISAICQALVANKRLRHLVVCPSLSSSNDLKELLQILVNHNHTMESISIHPSARKYASCKTIDYYLKLNQAGRSTAVAVATTPFVLVDLLAAVNEAHSPILRPKLQYGLLRESPGMWSATL